MTNHPVSIDPFGDSLLLLRAWRDAGVHLTREHVETAARVTGTPFGLLWDSILSHAPRKY